MPMLGASNVFEGAKVLVHAESEGNQGAAPPTECGQFPDKINSTLIWLRLKCSGAGIVGRNIKIQLSGTRTLAICGIRVYGSNDAPA